VLVTHSFRICKKHKIKGVRLVVFRAKIGNEYKSFKWTPDNRRPHRSLGTDMITIILYLRERTFLWLNIGCMWLSIETSGWLLWTLCLAFASRKSRKKMLCSMNNKHTSNARGYFYIIWHYHTQNFYIQPKYRIKRKPFLAHYHHLRKTLRSTEIKCSSFPQSLHLYASTVGQIGPRSHPSIYFHFSIKY
jgi:hypothetical protein